jgi:amino acid adenylation domain-containing protein
LLERGAGLVATLLGIVQAGGVYVPLDVDAPARRLAWQLQDLGCAVVVTTRGWRGTLPADVVRIDVDALPAAAPDPTPTPAAGRSSADLAYILYTSGSTGTPKGVMVSHRAVTRLVLDTDYVVLDAAERIAFASNPCFDAATFEIWGALLHGAALVVVPKDAVLSPRSLAAQLRRDGVTTLFLTPSVFNETVKEVPDAFRSVRNLLLGGEAPDLRYVREALRQGPPARLLNAYGPTEGTTFTTWFEVGDTAGLTGIPIGRPIANTQVYVLDAELQPVPVGVPGELYIGGDGLARGYLNQPGHTADRFVPHPYSTVPGARLYRTGDRVRYRPDGALEFLGRLDHQVKLRGVRIELGEIEATLGLHPDVRDAIVVVRNEVAGTPRLVAYVVAQPSRHPSRTALRSFLREHLLEHSIPSAFVVVDRLPVTANGKVDRRALPEPPPGRPDVDDAFAPPRTAEEVRIAEICAEVLGPDRVGLHDNFFDLGGHSLLATQLLARLRSAYGVAVPLRHFFEAPTVAELSSAIARGRQESCGAGAPSIPRVTQSPEQVLLENLDQMSSADVEWLLDELSSTDGGDA